MKIFSQENFGPIIPVLKFDSDKELIQLANHTNYGLAAYFYTKNLKSVESYRKFRIWNDRD